eukprot:6375018-Pyramimonas_sp.AAC.1
MASRGMLMVASAPFPYQYTMGVTKSCHALVQVDPASALAFRTCRSWRYLNHPNAHWLLS